MTSALRAEVVADLERDLGAGSTAGFQLHVRHRGDVVLDVAAGERAPGLPMTAGTRHNLYCGLKPVVAVAAAAELEAHGVDVATTPVAAVPGGLPADPRVTLGDVLAHDAGLAEPRLLDHFLQDRATVAAALTPAAIAGRLAAGRAAYSETAAWALLSYVCRRVSGRDLADVVDAHLAATGTSEVGLTIPDPAGRRDVGCYHDMAVTPPVPMLHDRTPRFAGAGPALVPLGYASMRGLAAWAAALLRVRAGAPAPGFPSPAECRRWTTTRRAATPDAVLARTCAFGYGVLTELAGHGFGPAPSTEAFGGVGFMGNSFVLADPVHDLVVACITNGLSPDPAHGPEVLRPRRVTAVYRALGLG